MDIWLFYLINRGLQNRFFDSLMPILSQESYFRIPLLLLWLALVIGGGSKGRVVAFLALLLLLFGDSVSYLVKLLVKRPRPCHVLPDVHLLLGCSRSYSFPSNHATNLFAVAAYLTYCWRWLLIPSLLLFVGVGFSRVYVGVHYPSDVAGGALVGLLCAAVAIYLHRQIMACWERRRQDRSGGSHA
jgi:undecaprenyl-diphosphatase